MESDKLSGYYTFRSLLNNPLPVDDFNRIKLEETELFLTIRCDGIITGTISFPAEYAASEKLFMDINGTLNTTLSQTTLQFIAKGRKDTEISDYSYEYSCAVTKSWEKGVDQLLSLTGTVIRSQDHKSEASLAKAGETSSFVAVKRDFIEPREIDKVAIIPPALSMLSSKLHRLQHTVWHTIRMRGVWYDLSEEEKMTLRNLGWGLDRPPFDENATLNLGNGAGEDFLFMHRKMITMMHDVYDSQGLSYIESWKTLPQSDAQQYFYEEKNDPASSDKKIYRLNILESGNMVPPAYVIPTDNNQDDLENLQFLKFLKSHEYFNNVMTRLERIFNNKTFLTKLTLGALGNLLEFEIHNQMHVRWSSISRDPESGEPVDRAFFDFNNKWDHQKYDYLGDFYSSHVNPLFWRLHGWIDDRIEDWFKTHEEIHPGEIERCEYQGVQWFKPGKWVQVSNPLYWPEKTHCHHNKDNEEINAMLQIMEIIRALFRRQEEEATATATTLSDFSFFEESDTGSMSFIHDIKPHK